jgi:TonB family protein
MHWRFILAGFYLCRMLLGGPVDVYRAGEGVPAPKVLHKVEPRYTLEARRATIQGTVVLEVLVDESGKAASSSVISPLGFGLDDRAREAVSQWSFQPSRKDGKPVKALTTVEVNFRLFHLPFDPRKEEQRTAYNLVVDAIQGHRRTEATLETLKNLAQQKYPPAMYLYAKLLQAGDGFPRDGGLAFQIISEAAEKNYASAVYEMGRMTMAGQRVEKDPEKGLELMRNAALLGSRQAQFFLGAAYENGDGVPPSAERARQYFRLCAATGETPCQVRLAQLLLQAAGDDHSGSGDRQYLQALAWLDLAAEQGDVQARMILDGERAGLSPQQVSWVSKLKEQFGRRP